MGTQRVSDGNGQPFAGRPPIIADVVIGIDGAGEHNAILEAHDTADLQVAWDKATAAFNASRAAEAQARAEAQAAEPA